MCEPLQGLGLSENEIVVFCTVIQLKMRFLLKEEEPFSLLFFAYIYSYNNIYSNACSRSAIQFPWDFRRSCCLLLSAIGGMVGELAAVVQLLMLSS